MSARNLALLTIFAAIITIGLKIVAYILTASVGLLSDVLESGLNLFSATMMTIAVVVAALPPDEGHRFGHYKAEYFSSGTQGVLLLVASIAILVSGVSRLLVPQPLMRIDIGLILAAVAAVINFLVARILFRVSRRRESVALDAEARHLMTDVWTTTGVILGLGLSYLADSLLIDPFIALAVGLHIAIQGYRITKGAISGLMDASLSPDEVAQIKSILDAQQLAGIEYHALRTRRSGTQRFVSVHIQVPGRWSVQRGHDLLEAIEADIRAKLPRVAVLTHLEPIEDPVSWQDIELNRTAMQEDSSE